MELDLFRLPVLFAGIATTVVAVAVGLMGSPSLARRIFATTFFLKGLVLTSYGLFTPTSLELTGFLLKAQQYLLLPIVPLTLYFVSIFPRRRGPLAFRGSGYVVLGVIVGLVFLYTLYPATGHTFARGTGSDDLESAGPGWVYTSYGPLIVVNAMANVAVATIGLMYAREAMRPTAQGHQMHYWFAVALILNGIFDGGMATAYLIHDPSIGGLHGLGWILGVTRALALLPAGVALGIIVGAELAKTAPDTGRVLVPSVLALAAWFSGPMPVILGGPSYGAAWPTAIAIGMWRFVVAALIGMALVQSRMASPTGQPSRNLHPMMEEA